MALTEQEAMKMIKEAQDDWDQESAHWDADSALCEFLESLGYGDLVEEYNKVEKWYA